MSYCQSVCSLLFPSRLGRFTCRLERRFPSLSSLSFPPRLTAGLARLDIFLLIRGLRQTGKLMPRGGGETGKEGKINKPWKSLPPPPRRASRGSGTAGTPRPARACRWSASSTAPPPGLAARRVACSKASSTTSAPAGCLVVMTVTVVPGPSSSSAASAGSSTLTWRSWAAPRRSASSRAVAAAVPAGPWPSCSSTSLLQVRCFVLGVYSIPHTSICLRGVVQGLHLSFKSGPPAETLATAPWTRRREAAGARLRAGPVRAAAVRRDARHCARLGRRRRVRPRRQVAGPLRRKPRELRPRPGRQRRRAVHAQPSAEDRRHG